MPISGGRLFQAETKKERLFQATAKRQSMFGQTRAQRRSSTSQFLCSSGISSCLFCSTVVPFLHFPYSAVCGPCQKLSLSLLGSRNSSTLSFSSFAFSLSLDSSHKRAKYVSSTIPKEFVCFNLFDPHKNSRILLKFLMISSF